MIYQPCSIKIVTYHFLKEIVQNFRLQVFASVAKNLSFTKASRELFITQPAITKHIKELEEEFGQRLFDRTGNKVALTPAGKVFQRYADQILELHRQLEYEISTHGKEIAGQLRLGASTTIAQYVIPQVISKFHKKFPKVNLSLLNGNTHHITEAVANGSIDLGIVEGKYKNKDVRYDAFIEDEVVAVVSTKNKLADLRGVTLEKLPEIPIVLREIGSGTRDVIEYELNAKKIKLSTLNVIMYLGSTETLKSFLLSSDCLGFVPIRAVRKELNAKLFKIIRIKDFQIFRKFDFITIRGPKPSGLNKEFMRFAGKHYN